MTSSGRRGRRRAPPGRRPGRCCPRCATFHGISSTVSSQVRIQPDSGEASLARSSRPTSRRAASRTLSGRSACLDPGAVVARAVRLVLAELLADRGELLAQQELALALLDALADVLGDLVGDLLLGEVLADPADQQSPAARSGRSVASSSRLLRQGQPRRVPGGVGQLGQVGHPLDRVDDLPRAALLQHGGDQRLVLAGQLAGAAGRAVRPRSGSPRPRARRRGRARRSRSGRGPRRGSPRPASPLDSRPTCSIVAIVPTGPYVAVECGARRAGSLSPAGTGGVHGGLGPASSVTGTTMPGSRTWSVRGRTGRVAIRYTSTSGT